MRDPCRNCSGFDTLGRKLGKRYNFSLVKPIEEPARDVRHSDLCVETNGNTPVPQVFWPPHIDAYVRAPSA